MNSVAPQQGQWVRLQRKSESLIYPALAFLSVFFVLPIIWFFIKSAADFDGNFGVMLYRTFTSRSEEHTSELQSLMSTSYAVFCLKKKKKKYRITSIIRPRTLT